MDIAKMLMGLAEKNTETIAKVTGRSPNQVKAALQQGQKMLPDIMKNATSAESGAKILDNIGVDKSFLNEAFNKYSPFLSKIPGMSAGIAKPILNMITGSMKGNNNSKQNPSESNNVIFDRSKYPKV